MTEPTAQIDALRAEAQVLARFIVRRQPSLTHVERYVRAHDHVFENAPTASERSLLAFVVRHPRTLPCLESAAALLRPDGRLHRKALLMATILEASPDHVDEFLPRHPGPARLAALAVATGLTAAAQLAVGVPLMLFLERSA